MLAGVFLLTQNSVKGGQDMLIATNKSIEVDRHDEAGPSVPKRPIILAQVVDIPA